MEHIVDNLPNFTQYNTIGADADLNSNGFLTLNEAQAGVNFIAEDSKIDSFLADLGGFFLADLIYQTTGRVASIKSVINLLIRVIIVANPTNTFRENDIIVTIDSAHGVDKYRALVDRHYCRAGHWFENNGFNGRTHADVADKDVAVLVAGWIKTAERQLGDTASFPIFAYGPEGVLRRPNMNIFECRVD